MMDGELLKKYVDIIKNWEDYNKSFKKVKSEEKLRVQTVQTVNKPAMSASEETVSKETVFSICNVDRSKRALLNLGAVSYKKFLSKAEAMLGVRVHEVVLEENGMLVNDNNFAILHKEPLMLLQSGEKWFSCDTDVILKHAKKAISDKIVSICNHTREKKCILRLTNDTEFNAFVSMASRYLNIMGKVVACEDSGTIVNDLDIINGKDKVLMILEANQHWHPR